VKVGVEEKAGTPIPPLEEIYQEQYARSESFRNIYLSGRMPKYEELANLIRGLGARSVLDLGCAYGQMVESLNASGVETWGIDLPVPVLQEYHAKLQRSSGRFLYGTVNEEPFVREAACRGYDLVCIIHTLRHITRVDHLLLLRPRWFLIQEGGDNFLIRFKRRRERDIRLWSPADLLGAFPGYFARRIWSTRFLFKVDRPGATALALMNLMPTYTILLEREA
jgi:2-polyprenyl-3-methyl-5-hydroxy-6-metoxy-1,4-benzoquinol methylase